MRLETVEHSGKQADMGETFIVTIEAEGRRLPAPEDDRETQTKDGE